MVRASRERPRAPVCVCACAGAHGKGIKKKKENSCASRRLRFITKADVDVQTGRITIHLVALLVSYPRRLHALLLVYIFHVQKDRAALLGELSTWRALFFLEAAE